MMSWNAFHTSRVSCQKGLICHAYAWQVRLLWLDTIDLWPFFLGKCIGHNGPVMRSFGVSCFVSLDILLDKPSKSLGFETSWRSYDFTLMHYNWFIHDCALMCICLCRCKLTNFNNIFCNILSNSNAFSVIILSHYYLEMLSTSVNIYIYITM